MTKIVPPNPRAAADSDKDSEEFDPYRYGPIPISTSFFKELISAPLPEASPEELYHDTLPPGVLRAGGQKQARGTRSGSAAALPANFHGRITRSRKWQVLLILMIVATGGLTWQFVSPNKADLTQRAAVPDGAASIDSLQRKQNDDVGRSEPSGAAQRKDVSSAHDHKNITTTPAHQAPQVRTPSQEPGQAPTKAKAQPAPPKNLYYEF